MSDDRFELSLTPAQGDEAVCDACGLRSRVLYTMTAVAGATKETLTGAECFDDFDFDALRESVVGWYERRASRAAKST